MVQKAKNTGRRIGRRGAVLLMMGAVFVLIGVNFNINQNDPSLQAGYAFAVSKAPLTFWAGVFIMTGCIAVFTSFRTLGRDAWGFGVLSGLAGIWGAMSFFTFLNFNTDRALITMLIWCGLAGLISIVSGMKGPNDD